MNLAGLTGGGIQMCECTWKWHKGKPCPTPAAIHDRGITTSPALCTQCLYVCMGESDDEDEAEWNKMEGK